MRVHSTWQLAQKFEQGAEERMADSSDRDDDRPILSYRRVEALADLMIANEANLWLLVAAAVSSAIYKSLLLVGVAAALQIAAGLMEQRGGTPDAQPA